MKLTLVSLTVNGKRYSAFVMADNNYISSEIITKIFGTTLPRGTTITVG